MYRLMMKVIIAALVIQKVEVIQAITILSMSMTYIELKEVAYPKEYYSISRKPSRHRLSDRLLEGGKQLKKDRQPIRSRKSSKDLQGTNGTN